VSRALALPVGYAICHGAEDEDEENIYEDQTFDGADLAGTAAGPGAAFCRHVGGHGSPPTFTITPSAGDNGVISPSTPQLVQQNADSATFTFTPDAGYRVHEVVVNGTPVVPTPSSYQFKKVNANHTISVSFVLDTFTITPSAGPNGAILPSAPWIVARDSTPLFTFLPNTGYHVHQILVDDSAVLMTGTNEYTFAAVAKDHTIAVSFAIDTFTLTYAAGAGGTIDGISPQTVDYGADGSTVTAVPATGHSFVKWSDGLTTASRTDTNVMEDLGVTAEFEAVHVTVLSKPTTLRSPASARPSPSGARSRRTPPTRR
jgi:hypothetical protein